MACELMSLPACCGRANGCCSPMRRCGLRVCGWLPARPWLRADSGVCLRSRHRPASPYGWLLRAAPAELHVRVFALAVRRIDEGDGCVLRRFEHRFLPGVVRGQQCAQQLVVEAVPGLEAAELADDAAAEQVQIADGVQDLVPHELVLVAKS